MDLSVYLNPTFEGLSFPERIERLAALDVPAFDFRHDDPHAIGAAADKHGLDVAYVSGLVGPTNDPGAVEERIVEVEDAIDTAADIGCGLLNVSPGQRLAEYDEVEQFEAVVEVLRETVPKAEAAGVTLLLEPLNTRVDHPGSFLSSSYEGYKILSAVDSPNAKLLFDVYHQEITEGDVVRNLRTHLDHVGHVHVADNPGRHEPGTGEIDYEFVIGALADAGYDGYLGCEFTPTGDPADAIRRVQSLVESASR
jgi:hydroxypyruvate isomerase